MLQMFMPDTQSEVDRMSTARDDQEVADELTFRK
jgi:hypothetical protein